MAAPLIRMNKPLAFGFVAILVLAGLAALPGAQAAPAIAGVTPSSGSTNGGTRITVSGSGFEAGAMVELGTTTQLSAANPGSSALRARDVDVTATSISATIPSHAAGTVGIRVTNPDGQSTTFTGLFTYVEAAAPTVSGVSPTSGTSNGGATVLVSGTNFDPAAGHPLVTFGGVPATVLSMTSTGITVLQPARVPSTVDVDVTNPDGQSDGCTGCFSFTNGGTPSISGVSPTIGVTAGGTVLTITGSNFAPGARVRFMDGTSGNDNDADPATDPFATTVSFANPGRLTAITPTVPSTSTFTVRVVNPDGVPSTGTTAFNFQGATGDPTITGLSPSSGPVSGGTVVTVTGTRFHTGSNEKPVVQLLDSCDGAVLATVPAHETQVLSATSLLVRLPGLSQQAVVLRITNPDSTSGCSTSTFQFFQPLEISDINPKSGPSTGGTGTGASQTPITITGSGFEPGVRVFFGAAEARVCTGTTADTTSMGSSHGCSTAPSATTLQAIPPAQAVPSGGATYVLVLNPDGRAASFYRYSYILGSAPRIDEGTPASTPTTNGGMTLTIDGANFAFGQDPDGPGPLEPVLPTVTVGGVAAPIKKSEVDSRYPVDLSNPCGAALESADFGRCRYPTGLVTSFSVLVPTRTDSAPSNVNTVVVNPDGRSDQSSDANERFSYSNANAPDVGVIEGLDSGPRTGGTVILVTGVALDPGILPVEDDDVAGVPSNFYVGGSNPTESWASRKPTVTIGDMPVPANQVFPLRPAEIALNRQCPQSSTQQGNCLVIVTPPYTAGTPGAAASNQAIRVTNPDGKSNAGSPADGFSYTSTPAPTFSGFDASSGSTNGGNVVTITGANFGPVTFDRHGRTCNGDLRHTVDVETDAAAFEGNHLATPVPTILFGSTPGTDVCVRSSSQITVRAPAHAAGAVSVTIRNPDTRQVVSSTQYTFTQASPPSGLSPSFGSSSLIGGRILTLTGNGFATPTVDADGNPCTMTAAQGFDRSQVVTPLPQVLFGGVPGTDVCVVSATELRVTVPGRSSAGSVGITVTNPDGQGTGHGPFRYLPLTPVVTSATPATSSLNGGSAGTLSGVNLGGTGLGVFVKPGAAGLGGTPARVGSTTASAAAYTVPPSATTGPADVKAVDADGQTGTLDNALTYQASLPPQFRSASPALGSLNGGSIITVEGAGFAGGASVRFDNDVSDTDDEPIRAVSVTPDGRRLSFVAPNFMETESQAVGPIEILVCNPVAVSCTVGAAHALYLPNVFGYTTVAGPTVTSVTPATGTTEGGTTVTITGSNFQSGATVKFGETDATDVVVVSATTITAKTPAHDAAAVTVTVTSGGQMASLSNGFTFVDPAAPSPTTSPTPTPTGTGTGTGTATGTGTGTGTATGPLALTPNQIRNANDRIVLTVTREGDANVLEWTLPSSTPAPVLGVQVWRSNSPYTLVQDIPATDPAFSSGTFSDTGSQARESTKYLVTMYYGLTSALGQFTAATAPDTNDYPGLASTDEQPSDDDGGGLPTWAIVLIALGILFLVVLVAVLIARGRNRDDQAGAQQGYAWEDADTAAAAETTPPAEVHQARCPVCSTSFTATGSKPIVTVCPGCGKKGILR